MPTIEPSIKQISEDGAEGQLLRRLLDEEKLGTRKFLEYKKKADEWDAYRKQRRASVQRFMGSATTLKIGELVAAVSEPKDQFSGAKFAAEYPALFAEFQRVNTVLALDVEALKAEYPELVEKFTVHTFLNKAS